MLKKLRKKFRAWLLNWRDFFLAYFSFFKNLLLNLFFRFEKIKNFFAGLLYRQRGRWSQPFAHFWLALFLFLGIALTPKIEESLRKQEFDWDTYSPSSSLAAYSAEGQSAATIESGHLRGEVTAYTVRQGDTVSSIANKFGVSIDTVIWANDIESVTKIKPGDRLRILPVTGIEHKVQRGETIYSIAKKYQANPQAVVDFPFNSFANDETFALAVGQTLIVPEGIMPKVKPVAPSAYIAQREVTVAVGEGNFIWPTSGKISQNYTWYHRAIDIANNQAPSVVAAASGRVAAVIYSRVGYGNHIVVDHGNGFQTLYGHLARIYIQDGQTVSSGQAVGQMGSTGRSTGIHLHFEVFKAGTKINPLTVLK